jgi:hypothetical protein
LFIAWQTAFDVSFTELGLAVALMSGARPCCKRRSASWWIATVRRFLIGGALLMSLASPPWLRHQLLADPGAGPATGMAIMFHPADYAILPARWTRTAWAALALHVQRQPGLPPRRR